MIYHWQLQRIGPRDKNDQRTEEQIRREHDLDLGVAQWNTPLNIRRTDDKPRVTEDGLKIPDWWTDDETESQAMMANLGLE